MESAPDVLQTQFCAALEAMSKSMADTRAVIRELCEKKNSDEFDIKDGISLLSLKHIVMLNYLHSLTLLTAQRVLGHSLTKRTPAGPFQSSQRGKRGSDAGDLVDSLIQDRLVLEKSKTLESRMRYQIEKLVRIAAEPSPNQDVEDPLSFRPNPDNFTRDNQKAMEDVEDAVADEEDEIYHPPKVAPMPYNEAVTKEKRRNRRVPAALSALAYQNPNEPYLESTSGLGGPGKHTVNTSSARARELARMTEYEESNMTRLVLNKKEAKRRRQDEETLALGGSILGTQYGRGRARGAGFADEFGDLLRSREGHNRQKDDYEELRARSKKQTAFERSKTRVVPDDDGIEASERPKKRTKFQKDIRKFNKRQR
ncbi:hypothetical protein FRC18_008903 [Serendipita sp. 400]|nr:hypothetical protein FRC18_008903 [Serendipita sp. 400]